MTTFLHILLLLVDIVATAWILFEIIPIIISDRIVGIPSFIISVILSICINIYIYMHGYYDLFIYFGIFIFIYILLYSKLDLEYHNIMGLFIEVVLGIALLLLSEYLSTKGFSSDASVLVTLALVVWWIVYVQIFVPCFSDTKRGSESFKRGARVVFHFIGICILIWFISDVMNGKL